MAKSNKSLAKEGIKDGAFVLIIFLTVIIAGIVGFVIGYNLS